MKSNYFSMVSSVFGMHIKYHKTEVFCVFMQHHYLNHNLKCSWKHVRDVSSEPKCSWLDHSPNELTCLSVSRGTKFQKSSEHSEPGSASTWAQHASDSTDHFHSYCTAFSCLTSHSLSIVIKKETNMRRTLLIIYSQYTECCIHTHWALVMCLQCTHSWAWACPYIGKWRLILNKNWEDNLKSVRQAKQIYKIFFRNNQKSSKEKLQ